MKIIIKSNYDSETQSDRLFAEHVPNLVAAVIAHLMNSCFIDNHPDYYVAVPDDHKLYVWEPDECQ